MAPARKKTHKKLERRQRTPSPRKKIPKREKRIPVQRPLPAKPVPPAGIPAPPAKQEPPAPVKVAAEKPLAQAPVPPVAVAAAQKKPVPPAPSKAAPANAGPTFKPSLKSSPAEEGASAKAYAAYFGEWRKITDVYTEVYAGNAKAPNTGRISEVTRELLKAGLLEKKEQEARWPLYRATLSWLWGEFAEKGIALSEEDAATLQHALFPAQEEFRRQAPDFGLSKEEASGRVPFKPTPQKIRAFLHAGVSLALFLLGNAEKGLPAPVSATALSRIKANLGIYEKIKPAPESEAGKPQVPATTVAALAGGPLVESFGTFLLMKYRTAIRDREAPEHTLLYKLVRILYDARSGEMLWRHVQGEA